MRFLFLGDSITVGMAEALGSFMEQLGQQGDIVAESGISVRGMADSEMLDTALAKRPTSVVVMLGTNPDGILPADSFRAACLDLLRKIWTTGAAIGWIGPWAGDDIDSRLRVISDLVRVRWANGVAMGAGLERSGENQVHFTSEAYPELARRVAEWSVRIADPRVLTYPRTTGKVVSVLGVAAAAAVPAVIGRW